jgi:type I site-specific restriction endonuclease
LFAPTHFPDYRELDTPWEPQEIQWRQRLLFDQHVHNKPALEKYVAKPQHTHLVREVQATIYDQLPPSDIDEIKEICKLADEQFDFLESTSPLKVAPTEWHVFKDTDDVVRVLARVGIIEGTPYFSDEQEESLVDEIDKYESRPGEMVLADLWVGQFLYGSPRANKSLSQSALFLVDIEPLLKRTV